MQNVGFVFVEAVIDYGQGEVAALFVSLEESAEGEVKFWSDFVEGSYYFFPPGAESAKYGYTCKYCKEDCETNA